ncbi:MAG: type II toxin-antitoxin system VapC family toxin [Myxococcales bacterium]|nr:type II toxin-antitoxin system VapC family toxin [Myxococcales bacterium]
MSAERVTYLDSSAVVKLVVREAESVALRRYLRGRRPVVASALAHVEVLRAVLALGDAVHERAGEVLSRIEMVRINDRVLAIASKLSPADLRSLDAIHLATASLFGDALGKIVTYDARMAEAAKALGYTVVAPS